MYVGQNIGLVLYVSRGGILFCTLQRGSVARKPEWFSTSASTEEICQENVLTFVVEKEVSEINQVHYCDVLTD
jgi:hypothetical protein